MVAKSFQLGVIVILIAFVSGCSSLQVESEASQEETTSGAMTTKPMEKADPGYESAEKAASSDSPRSSSEPENTKNQVVEQLQREALASQARGDWAESELKLERALRILGDKPDLYRQLATVRMGQKRFDEAEQIALKGLTHANEDPEVKAALWQIIAQSRSATGNISGADEAREEMNKWSRIANGVE
jgi:predicted Zn-dependent protease